MQEAAAKFANTILASLNQAATEVAGVDVLWFRATPDKNSQDVIFQSYTLYGVEDCPLQFKALYNDVSYDDAAITYNIMGISYAIPMTMDIAVNTWNTATSNDGTIPQQHDIVYIPMSRKLLEVTSMQPTKTIGAQLTTYKVNLEIYKPTRSRLLGENLKESIKQTTTNLDEKFGDEIDEAIKDIVDDNQLSIYTSTSQDKHKTVAPTVTKDSGIFDIRTIVNEKLVVDGHTVATSYYSLYSDDGVAVKYKVDNDFDTSTGNICYSCWFRPKDIPTNSILKNVKGGTTYSEDASYGYLSLKLGTKFKKGTNVVFKRGKMIVPGYVISQNKIQINKEIAKSMSKMTTNWYTLPGFAVLNDNVINLLNGGNFSIDIKAGNYISFNRDGNEQLVLLNSELKNEYWYGLVLNIGEKLSVDVYSSDGGLNRVTSRHETQNSVMTNMDTDNFSLKQSYVDITNIRLYDVENNDIDKQITDLVSHNAKNNSHCIINDSADVYLNKPYVGRQR
jgi:hypothetical protein